MATVPDTQRDDRATGNRHEKAKNEERFAGREVIVRRQCGEGDALFLNGVPLSVHQGARPGLRL